MSGIIVNPASGKQEKAKKVECPRCKGKGSAAFDKNICWFCKGHGTVWQSIDSPSLYRPVHSSVELVREWHLDTPFDEDQPTM